MSDNEWIEIEKETTRRVMTKSNHGIYQEFTNVTHFKKRSHGWLIRCDQGVVYFESDDVSHIISACNDWVA